MHILQFYLLFNFTRLDMIVIQIFWHENRFEKSLVVAKFKGFYMWFFFCVSVFHSKFEVGFFFDPNNLSVYLSKAVDLRVQKDQFNFFLSTREREKTLCSRCVTDATPCLCCTTGQWPGAVMTIIAITMIEQNATDISAMC